MDKRASKTPTTGTAKATPGDEAKKKLSVTERLSTTTSSRTSALSARANGSTITSKPPTRPVSSTVRKPTAKSTDDAVAKDENRRLSRASTSTAASLSSRSVKPESSADKAAATTRRTTLGSSNTASASAPPKRPSTLSSRASSASATASPTTSARPRPAASSTISSRPSSRATVSTTSTEDVTPAESVASRSVASTTRPLSRDTIPEEPESLSGKAQGVRTLDAPFSPASPRKLEIRSGKSATPILKPQAASDAETEMKPKTSSRHGRSQPKVERPSTAPSQRLTEQEQNMREMEVMQSFLRESIARDTLAAEIVDLKAELQQLERQNKQIVESAKAAPPSANEDAATEAHEQLESAKATYEKSISELKSAHAGELESLEAELESYRHRSSRLEGVETKIGAVQEALEESKTQASQNEKDLQQELQEKEQDRGQLASVVEELREEIDRCQLKLDEDTKAQAKEKEEAEQAAEKLRKELDDVKEHSAADIAQAKETAAQLAKDLAEERQRNINSAAANSASQVFREQSAREIEELKASLSTAEEAAEQLRKELDLVQKQVRENAERASIGKAEVSELKASASAAEEAAEQLRKELDAERQKMQESAARASAEKVEASERLEKASNESHRREIEELQNSADEVKEANARLQAEIDALHARDAEGSEKTKAALESSANIIKRLEDEAEKLTASHAAELETHVQRARESESLLEDLRQQVDQLHKAREIELSNSEESNKQTRQVIDGLRAEVGELHKLREAEETSREESSTMRQVVQDLQSQIQKLQHDGSDGQTIVEELQTQLAEFQHTKADLEKNHKQELQKLQNTIISLQNDSRSLTELHSQALAQRDQESQALNLVVQGLQTKVAGQQQQLEDVKHSKEESMHHMDELITSLREEARAVKEKSVAQVVEKDNEQNELRKVVEELQRKIVEHQQSSEDLRIRAETESNSVGKVLEGLQNELQVLQHKLHDEQAARQLAVQQTKDLQQAYDGLKNQHQELQSTHKTAEQQLADMQQLRSARDEIQKMYDAVAIAADEKQARIDELAALVAEANEAKVTAESTLFNAQEELKSLQNVLSTFTQDQDERDTKHASALKNLEKDHEIVLEEKQILEKKLGDIAMQHNRELEEEAQKHEATYRELQASFTQLKDVQSRSGAVAEEQLDTMRLRLQGSIDDLKSEHARTISALVDEHAASLREMMNKHLVQVQEIEALAAERTANEVAERERAHEGELAELKVEHSRTRQTAVAEQEQAHQAAIATLMADHASRNEVVIDALHEEHTAIREAALAALRAEFADAQMPAAVTPSARVAESADTRLRSQSSRVPEPIEVPSTLTTPKNDGVPANGLSHVFGHLIVKSKDEITPMSDTPLAHGLENERSFSPTPAYPRDGNRAGAELGFQNQLRKDNAGLNALLKAARDEIATLKGTTTVPQGTKLIAPSEGFTAHTRRNSFSADDDQNDATGDSFTSMSLEGTMESLRVQTEQLLELNEDFLAEQQRWSVGLRRKNSMQQRSSPLRASS